ncbi:sporulation protein YpjB [Salibacterium sp. K-3]
MTSTITGKRAAWILCAAAVLIFFHTEPLKAETDPPPTMEMVDDKAASMYEMAENGQFEEAKQIHAWIAGRLPAISFDDYQLNTAQLTAFLRSFDRAGGALVDVDMEETERVRRILAFRLAADASIRSTNPIWKEHARTLAGRLDRIKEYLEKGETKKAEQLFHEWQRQFEIIRPAMYTGEQEENYMPFVSYIRFMDRQNWSDDGQVSRVETLYDYFLKVLGDHKESAVDPSLWAVIFSIGSAVFVSLTYTGWKKYKGEKERHQMRDE